MKKRTGFVSNSSSSSFIIGHVCSVNNVSNKILDDDVIKIPYKLSELGTLCDNVGDMINFLCDEFYNSNIDIDDVMNALETNNKSKLETLINNNESNKQFLKMYNIIKEGGKLFFVTFFGGVDGEYYSDTIFIKKVLTELQFLGIHVIYSIDDCENSY